MSDKTKPSDEESALFRRTVGAVQPIKQQYVLSTAPRPSATVKKKEETDEGVQTTPIATALPSLLLRAEDRLHYLCNGVQKRELKRLYRGYYPIERELDLHQMMVTHAQRQLSSFILQCNKRQAVKIIHGKGHGSPDQQPILKNKLNHWLKQLPAVLAFCSARPSDGGTGAAYVLIRPCRR